MKFSEQWLREWVSPQLGVQGLADQITMAGLEVDAVEPVASAFSGVVVAEVVDKQPHPDADKLNVCQVVDGDGEPVQVVCGATNVAIGQKVPFARVGAVLPGDFKIKQAKLRGVESRGMICSASELGLAEETSGGILVLPADAPAGEDFRAWMGLDDHTVEVDLTPNRGDCLSLKGLAREVGVLNRLPVTPPAIEPVAAGHDETFPVRVEDPERCPRYIGRLIKGVDVTAATPLWMVERLRRSGIRSIDPVVDVTNYVMLELGQPLHAFDRDNLHGAVVVRLARQGERLILLDGQEITLEASTLVIADERGPLAIAGVMGGEHSGVGPATRDIFLESAFFSPLAVAGQARSYGLHTDASHRFERGVDPQLTREAVERATALLLAITGGEPGPLVEVASAAHLPAEREVTLRAARLEQALCKALPSAEVQEILERLGLQVSATEAGWQARVPSWRFDIAIEEDLIEEVARIHGYNRLPVRRPAARLALRPDHEARTPLARLRRQMVARGYQEAVTYSFVAPELQQLLLPDAVSPRLANPISSDLAVMRASLFPGLVRALEYNLNRQQTRVRLFETGLVFRGDLDQLDQTPMVGALVCGERFPEGWSGGRDKVDFFDLKGDLESLIALGGEEGAWRFEPGEHPALHPGQSARIVYRGEAVGWIGALHPGVKAELGLKTEAFLFEVRQDALTHGVLPRFEPLSRYPEVRRDLAFLLGEERPVQALLDCVRDQAGEWLQELRLFDVYQGKGVPEGSKSVALGLTWQHPSRTLNDDEINQLVDAIVAESHQHLGAELRG
ncbi:phenylalanine--tRNA ligase subunit beta [Halomonas sp. MCCC 1A17488]|uniref:phenylalanine--tRNA ligase subunit beta n=1 Tax=unclassified Halomonas TaxID=2609666 RepID=UPI0018D263A8|nr:MULTISPECIES: phenylalanine--tRNA ligase subunit beta [unclassified Halomonas]MCE8015035.1 phenylalanine--tRNA ligase subunit beta [Halomonas sp. MCCC 1A17488]MCG3238368.1 phenylalanine--tRNA ligase subunit beta [Halomonas sp. MCCC 1A17488]QPP47886.1 phenylalanine--tRNA ligase subunit beta [Halomonas sp. SS10-MC5]